MKKPIWILRRIYNFLFFIEGMKRISYNMCPYCQNFKPTSHTCSVCDDYITNIDEIGFPPSLELKKEWTNRFIDHVLYKD